MIYSDVAWCCSGKHDNHLIHPSVASLVFYFYSLHLFNDKRNDNCLCVSGSLTLTSRTKENLLKLVNDYASHFNLNSKLFLREYGKNMFIVLLLCCLLAFSPPSPLL